MDSLEKKVSIDFLIDVVERGGAIRTGVDIFDRNGVLLLEKSVRVDQVKPLLVIKKNGVIDLTIRKTDRWGMWDRKGDKISFFDYGPALFQESSDDGPLVDSEKLQKRITEILVMKQEAAAKYRVAKRAIKQVISDIKRTGGEFDQTVVETTVTDLMSFMTKNEDSFAYLTREIFTFDDYLYNHSVNVCTIGAAVLHKFNHQFSQFINSALKSSRYPEDFPGPRFSYYLSDEIKNIATGFFLHDLGKVAVAEEILNKQGELTPEEFREIKSHSFQKGVEILDRNRISNPYVANVVKYHHSPLFQYEPQCYPNEKPPEAIPIYVKICKLADIYDAMTSKRCYKDAFNPIGVVAEIFRKYADKDSMLQFILHSFIKSVGIYPAGSVVSLQNGQIGIILDSKGPIVLPFTDETGTPLPDKMAPLDLSDTDNSSSDLAIDRKKPLMNPAQVFNILPAYMQRIFKH